MRARLVIPKRTGGRDQPGPWWHPVDDGTATVRCPGCGTIAHLDHVVSVEGVVSPTLVCPNDGCTWHVWAELAGWAA